MKEDEEDVDTPTDEKEVVGEGAHAANPEGGNLIPQGGGLNEALEERGPDAVDGIRREGITGASGSNACPVPGCQLPGGHYGPHEGPEGRFLYDMYDGKKWMVDGEIPSPEESDTDSSTSEELVPDGGPPIEVEENEVPEETFVDWLAHNHKERKMNVWLSKKMSEKGKEVVWNQLPLSKKKEFDLAQARELNQVAVSKALRKLTETEMMMVPSAART